MLRWTKPQREFVADKLLDAANLVAGAVVVGSVLGDSGASGRLLLGAVALWTAAFVFAVILMRNRR
jgi:hypothetical protein